MIKKGIILAGGTGSRMSPITKSINKQLLPIYDKPLIYYPLSVLMLTGIKKIEVIVNIGQKNQFFKLLGDGSRFGVELTYAEQIKPAGLPEAFLISKNFIGNDNIALILGDNFFYGQSFTNKLKNSSKIVNGSKIFLHTVSNPRLYGVAEIKKNKIIKITEKPNTPKSNLAVTGLYFFDNNVIKYTSKLKPSKRNELEITDLLKIYLKKKKLNYELIGRGAVWMDTGNINDYYETSSYVSSIEKRQGLKIACLEEIAFRNNWIKKRDIIKSIKFYGHCNYSKYLSKLI